MNNNFGVFFIFPEGCNSSELHPLVTELVTKLDIELLLLPSYSPNLNLIKRLWKWVRKDCLNCKYYQCFDEFKDAINRSLLKVTQDETKKMDSLLNLKFQLFDNAIYNRV